MIFVVGGWIVLFMFWVFFWFLVGVGCCYGKCMLVFFCIVVFVGIVVFM